MNADVPIEHCAYNAFAFDFLTVSPVFATAVFNQKIFAAVSG
jgi:hypothetical protein